VPLRVGVLLFVGDETEIVGELGNAVSTNSDTALLARLVFPAESLAVAVSE
jgi:hypothetical protein